MKLPSFLRRRRRGADGSVPADSYSPPFAFIYIFNLIVGVGALALPIAFNQAGLIIGTILMVLLCSLSYVTSTYVIEAMSVANALHRHRKMLERASPELQRGDESVSSEEGGEETTPLVPAQPVDLFEITVKFEMAEMATMFFNKVGLVAYYVCKCLYLYGDLAIYAIAVPKSIATTVCIPKPVTNITNTSKPCNDTKYSEDMFMFSGSHDTSTTDTCAGPLTSQQIYYISLAAFIIVIGPFSFFNIQRTKILQLITSVLRNITFATMIILVIVQIGLGLNKGVSPTLANPQGLPALFGISIYSFMCHHSLPGMITPMSTKRHLYKLLLVDFILILSLYLLLSYTAVFRFGSLLQDLYTLNFFPPDSYTPAVISYFIVLFPVFTLTTNFPIISVTLRETIKELFLTFKKNRRYHFLIVRIAFPLIAIVPPFAIAFGTQNEELLVAITGSLPGVGVQYVIPVFLAFVARRMATKELGSYNNKHHSIVNRNVFSVLILVWAAICIVLVLVYQILKILEQPLTLVETVCRVNSTGNATAEW